VVSKSLNSHIYKNYLINGEKISPNVSKALEFYQNHILRADQDLSPLLETYHFKNRIPAWKWELFSGILVGDTAKNSGASDLKNHEVKSAQAGNSFEYLYYRKSWKKKLKKEVNINHVYVSYYEGYRNLDVRLISGKKLAHIFNSWIPELEEMYGGPKTTKSPRFRKSISFGAAKKFGKVILEIRNGALLYGSPDPSSLGLLSGP